jgi:pyruvate,water dikinase
MKHVLRGDGAPLDAPLGGKARALAALEQADLPIPPWLVVLPSAFYAGLPPDQVEKLNATEDEHAIREIAGRAAVSPEVQAELAATLSELCPNSEAVAVRSSASDEDGSQHSFAGQLDSYLFVPPAEVPEKVAAVWRSGFSERITAYRREHGLRLVPQAPTVLLQRMVQADVSGVAFGADPVSGRRGVAVVSAVYGLGTALVSGECDADTYHVDRDGHIAKREIAEKRTMHQPEPRSKEGVTSVPVPEGLVQKPALTDERVGAVAELARRTGQFFGRPQDIEWAAEDGRLYLLQSRPITTLAQTADPDGVLNIWDNSNIAESYNGVTTPLTFSFARRIYEEVYRQFCRILRVPEQAIADNDEVFRHMLGLIRGRVYYNLLNWYRLLTLLPGFQANRQFMEQMMGVKEGLPESIAVELKPTTWRSRLRDRARFLGSVFAIVRQHWGINTTIRRFEQRLLHALGESCPNLARMRLDELSVYYRDLERQLLLRWDAPLINDFLAMIFHGLLRKLTEKWCRGGGEHLYNDLLCGEGGMISAEPALRVRAMAECARVDTALTVALCDGTLAEVRRAIREHAAFARLYQEYLDKFGDRCMEELKLESPTLHDDPLPLLRSVGNLAQRLARGEKTAVAEQEVTQRQRAEAQVRAALRWHPLRRPLFSWVLRNARARVRDRENLRFERTRLFGRVRRIVVEMGKLLHALDLLGEPRDVFYLELNELLGFIDGTASCTDLRGLVSVRRAEFERYRREPAPADRFETRGAVHQGNTFAGTSVAEEISGDRREGLGCCPGVVRGPVRVITDPRGATLRSGEILVAERTDPGWIMLFPAAAGLLVERGSLLSHSAIVARELGIPAVVSLRGVTSWLRDGDWVELDGGKGTVRKINPSSA